MQLNIANLSYTYPSQSETLFNHVTFTLAPGWTAFVGNNGIGKSTLAKLLIGKLPLQEGSILPRPDTFVSAYCPQDTAEEPPNLMDVASDWSSQAIAIRSSLALEDDWFYRYPNLSGGQAKRVQIACALACSPDVLVLDEPTNHVDSRTRKQIIRAMQAYQGIGVVISHDLQLMDETCTRTLRFERVHVDGANRTEVSLFSGNASQSEMQVEQSDRESRERLAQAKSETRRLRAVQMQRREKVREAARAANKQVDRKDHDACKAKKYAKGGKDAGVAQAAARMNARVERAERAGEGIVTRAKQYDGDFWVAQEPSHVREVVHLQAGVIVPGESEVRVHPPESYNLASELAVRGERWEVRACEDGQESTECLVIPEISIGPREHVMLTGDNGLGKSSLLEVLCAHVNPQVKTLVIRQDARDVAGALKRLGELNAEARSQVLHAYAQLNADPGKLLESGTCSPGELRKLLLALAVVERVEMIVMDEPTNHLDLTSKRALARVLASFEGALVMVSHDREFLRAVDSAR